MKILITIPCLLTGGTEIQTLTLAKALVQSGHTVSVLCYFEYADDMVSQFKKTGCRVVCLSDDGSRKQGIGVVGFLYKGLKREVKQFKPEIVHVQYMAPGAIPIVLLRFMGVRTIIATAHTAADIYSSLRLVHYIQQHCLRAFTCITERAEKSFFGSSSLYTQETNLKKRNHFTIYNALPAHINVRKEARCFHAELTIGVVSRLETIKGMDLVIPAFAKIVERHSDVRLLVVGDGSQREGMLKQAFALGVESKMEWVGRQGADALESYYDAIDVLLMPSRSEGFGLTAIEGMARGCVVVAADTGGLPEVVKDGYIGLLHEPENIDDMVEKVLSLLKDRVQLCALSTNAVCYVNKFSGANYAYLFNDLYSKL